MTVSLIIFLFIAFLGYNILIFKLVNSLLENPRLKGPYIVLVGLMNTLIALFVSQISGLSSVVSYILFAVIMLVEYVIFYKDKFIRSFFCMLACIIHLMSVRSLCTGLFGWYYGISLYDVVSDPVTWAYSIVSTLVVLNFAIVFVIKFIPAKSVKIINQHTEQVLFMVAWICVFCGYLLMNAKVYAVPATHPYLIENQIFAPLTIMVGVYIILLFAFKTSALLGYKEKNEELSHAVEKERQYRESIDKDVHRIIEVNFSRDQLISGFEEYKDRLGDIIYSYSKMLAFMIKHFVHPNDAGEFTKYSSPQTVINLYASGLREIVFDYRRLMPSGEYLWMHVIMPLMMDHETGELRGFVQIRNIDTEKKQQLELQFKAERDALTGLYNKEMTAKLISEMLSVTNPDVQSGVLFMIDIDNFKTINDSLGHIYGDAVLSELSEKLKEIFREKDIVGRIGGDEFIVFMAGNISDQLIIQKAEDVCKAFQRSYSDSQSELYTVSSSIGIAVFPKDGQDFETLYKNADAALYSSKNSGKNTYVRYDGKEFVGYKSNRTELKQQNSDITHAQKNFKENRIEYTFKILYNSYTPISAIHSVLELLTSHFHFDRGYIFETSRDGSTTSNTFEWCAEGITSQIENLQNIPIDAVATANAHFNKNGMFILRSLNELPELDRKVLEPQNIKSMFQFGIFEGTQLLGFIGFDNCKSESVPKNEEIDEISTICNILSTFFLKQRAIDRSENNLKALSTVMNHLDSYLYVVDRDTYHVLFINEKMEQIVGKVSELDYCFSVFRGRTVPCADCPIKYVPKNSINKFSTEFFHNRFDRVVLVTVSALEWVDGSSACLINVEINENKE